VISAWSLSEPVAPAASPPTTPAAQPPALASSGADGLSAQLAGLGVAAADADAAMSAFNVAFYVESKGAGLFRATTTASTWPPFWRSAELIEMVEDAYQRSGRPVYRRMVRELRRGVLARFGTNWTGHRKYNDDVMWMVLAFLRGYEITGDTAFRDVAQRNFDAAFARGWSDDFGGGLWWTTDRQEKNACVAGPAAIAARHLYRALGNASYLVKARRLYSWLRQHLFDATTGAVYDNVSRGEDGSDRVDRAVYTYNQGTFIGAADLLYRTTNASTYYDDAQRALEFAKTDLTVDGVLREEGVGRDGGGFKGIFARYAVEFVRHHRITSHGSWFALNARAAWSFRDARGLMGQDWSSATSSGKLHAFDCSSAVVLLQQLRQP